MYFLYEVCLAIATLFKATQKKDECGGKIFMLMTCFEVRGHKGNCWLANTAALSVGEWVHFIVAALGGDSWVLI